jgi:predicted HicB family RNase H-like nuclease
MTPKDTIKTLGILKMTEAEKRTQARIPAPVHQWLAERAKANDRSMNAELVRILKEAMKREATEQKQAAA